MNLRTQRLACLQNMTKDSSSKQSEVNTGQEKAGGKKLAFLFSVSAQNSASFFLPLQESEQDHHGNTSLPFFVLSHRLATWDTLQPLVKERQTITANSAYWVPGTGRRIQGVGGRKGEAGWGMMAKKTELQI